MNVIADTNVLVRFLVADDEEQCRAAARLLEKAAEIIIPTHVFCELAWVLLSAYKHRPSQVRARIADILNSHKVAARDDEVQAGLRMLDQGGDFADGVNAYCGRIMARGPSTFASFDRQAVRLLTGQGIPALR